MVKQVSRLPPGLPKGETDSERIMVRSLTALFVEYANRLNAALVNDGTLRMIAPLPLKESTVADLADFAAADWDGSLIAVTNEAGGYTVAFSDGTNWRRVQDRVIVS